MTLQSTLHVSARQSVIKITAPNTLQSHSPCVSCDPTLPRWHYWVWVQSAVRWVWSHVGVCDYVVVVLSLVLHHSVAMHLHHYCYLQDHQLLGVAESWRVSRGSNCSCLHSDQSDRSVKRIGGTSENGSIPQMDSVLFSAIPSGYIQTINWKKYIIRVNIIFPLITNITLCLTTKPLRTFPAYCGHMTKICSLLFHIYINQQSHKHISMSLLQTNRNKRCVKLNIVALTEFNLCINSCTKTCFSGK